MVSSALFLDYILRSARFIAADVFRQVIRPGDTVVVVTTGLGALQSLNDIFA